MMSSEKPYEPGINYTKLSNIIIDKYAEILTETGIALYWFYARNVNKQLGYAYPSIRTTSKKLGISNWKIYRYNELLEELGLIYIKKGLGRRNNQYYIKRPSDKALRDYKDKHKPS